MNHSMNEQMSSCERGGDAVADYLETIALLQGEIERLERELSDRELAETDRAWRISAQEAACHETCTDAAEEASARANLARLEAELAAREETIGLLMEQLSRMEEAQASSHAEWDQLSEWLAEVERRVDGQAGVAAAELQEQLAAERSRAEELGRLVTAERREAEAQRRRFEGEIARLQERLAGSATGGSAAADPEPCLETAELERLRVENQQLREACARGLGQPAGEVLEARLAEVIEEREGLRRQLERLRDECKRQELEHAAATAELRAQLSRASVVSAAGPAEGAQPPKVSPAREEQLRFQALRQHLLDIYELEERQRKERQLLPRLRRLWNRTGPK